VGDGCREFGRDFQGGEKGPSVEGIRGKREKREQLETEQNLGSDSHKKRLGGGWNGTIYLGQKNKEGGGLESPGKDEIQSGNPTGNPKRWNCKGKTQE